MYRLLSFTILLAISLVIGSAVLAQSNNQAPVSDNKMDLQDAFGNKELDTGMTGLVGTEAGYNVLQRDVDPIIANIIAVVLSFLGVIFIALMIYGGYLWMTATGNEEQVDKARNLIKAALIGLLIVIAAYAITYFVFFRMAADLIE
ncbi:MAG: hypothetical protein ABIG10_01045 [bacterium]